MEIHLQDLKFNAQHGVFSEENITGNLYTVNVWATINIVDKEIYVLEDTVNYADIYNVVNSIMQQPTPLLETIASQICLQILQQFNTVNTVKASVYKHTPPIIGYRGSVGISVTKHRK